MDPLFNSYFSSDPSVFLANAGQVRDINSLDAWLKAKQQLAILNNNVMQRRLDRGFGLSRQSLLDNLAARGMNRSGDVGYQQNLLAQSYADKRYDAAAPSLQGLASTMGSYLQRKNALRNATTSAYLKAFGTYGKNPSWAAPTAPKKGSI